MSDPSVMDNSRAHLYPPFAAKVHDILAEANRECAALWDEFSHFEMVEGYRSAERQRWLYAQGRTRPGQIVTKDKIPSHHGYGLAADCVPYDKIGRPRWDAPEALWQQFGHCVRAADMEWGGGWHFVDKPHVQGPDSMKTAAVIYLHSIGLTTP